MRRVSGSATCLMLAGLTAALFAPPRSEASARALSPAGGVPAEQGSLPDAPGRDAVERACTSCHGVDYLTTGDRTVPAWRDTLEVMKSYGATASDEDWKAITDYVIAHLATLSVNKASAPEIALVLAMPAGAAESVVAHRDKQGGFKTIDDLKQAPEVDAARIDAVRDRLTFE